MHGGDRRLFLTFTLAAGVAFLLPVVGFPAERLPPEVEAIRAERERERAALDRIRRKVEALREAEGRGGNTVPAVSPTSNSMLERDRARLHAEAEARWREGERRLRAQNERIWAEQAAREQAARKEREAREREETHRLEAKREQERLAAKRHAERNRTLFLALAALYGALCFLPFVPLYRDFIDYDQKRSDLTGSSVVFGISGLCFIGAVWMSDTVSLVAIPDWFLLLGFLGLYFWFFVPGLFAQFLIFLHSLFVPHPLETAFQRVLRGQAISRDEAARVADAIRTFHQNGSPADWRVKSALSRLERLAKLMGRENTFVDFLSEYILHQNEQNKTGRRQ